MKKKYSLNKNINLYSVLFLLMSFTSVSQDLTFTMDTAVDNGTSISETITVGVDTFVLTATATTDAQLFDLGGGDNIFFSNTDVALNPWIITLTKNGSSENFELHGVNYDTIEAGDISVEDQNNATIADRKTYPVGSGALTFTNMANSANISSFKITPYDSDDLNDFGFHDIHLTPTGIPLNTELNNIISKAINVYPNPSNGNMNIKNSSNEAIKNYSIVDLNGKLIFEKKTSNSTIENINLSNQLSSGMYLLKVNTENTFFVKRILIN